MKKRKSAHKKKSLSRKSIPSHRYFLIVVSAIVLFIAAANIQTTQVLGTASQGNVLGDDDQKQEEKKQEENKQENKGNENKQEEQKKSNEQQQEAQQKQAEQQRETSKQQNATGNRVSPLLKTGSETSLPNGLNMKTQSEGGKQETEIETANGQKIKTKVEDDGSTKVEVEQGGMKLKYVIKNGQTVLKVENENGDETEVSDDRLAELKSEAEQELEDQDVEISSRSGRISLAKNNVTATTKFPLSINTTTKQLVVTTPSGEKVVAVLPDQAIKNLLATGVVNKVDEAASGGNTELLNDNVQIELRNGEAVYRVKGARSHKLFGFIPVNTPVTAFVSAESGIPVASQQSILSRVIDTFSP